MMYSLTPGERENVKSGGGNDVRKKEHKKDKSNKGKTTNNCTQEPKIKKALKLGVNLIAQG